MVGSGSAAESEAVVVESPASSVASLVTAAKQEALSLNAVTTSAEASLVLVSGPLAPSNTPKAEISDLLVVDATVAEVAPVDIFIGPLSNAPLTDRSLDNRSSGLRDAEHDETRVTRHSLRGNAERFDFMQKLRNTRPVASVPTEESISTAAELFDAHPESLDGVFDFEFEDTFAGLID